MNNPGDKTPIDMKYAKLGGGGSFLGQPTADEEVCADGIGCYRDYQGGSIYWHPHAGTHDISGDLHWYWTNHDREKGPLGYPLTDELRTPTGARYSVFEGGVLYWKPGNEAAIAINMDIGKDTVLQAIDAEVQKIIKETPLISTGPTKMAKVHHWYTYEGQSYCRVMELRFPMEAQVKMTALYPDVDLRLYLSFEAQEGNVLVTLIREEHLVASTWWKEWLSIGFQDMVHRLVDKELGEQLGKAIGRSVAIPAGANLLAAHLQDNGALRLYYGD